MKRTTTLMRCYCLWCKIKLLKNSSSVYRLLCTFFFFLVFSVSFECSFICALRIHIYICVCFFARYGHCAMYQGFFSRCLSVCTFFSLVFPLFICTTFFWRGSLFLIHSSSSFLCTHPDPNTNEQNYYL